MSNPTIALIIDSSGSMGSLHYLEPAKTDACTKCGKPEGKSSTY